MIFKAGIQHQYLMRLVNGRTEKQLYKASVVVINLSKLHLLKIRHLFALTKGTPNQFYWKEMFG